MPLTDAVCRSAKCLTAQSRVRLADSGGLYLEVLRNGGKYWRWKFRHAGKEKRLSLGVYPRVTLAGARKARDEARTVLEGGLDPSQERRASARARLVAENTSFEAVARAWHVDWKSARTDHHADYVLRRLEADVFPVIGHKGIAEITAPQLVAMAKRVEARGALDIAKRALQTCGQIFRYAVGHGVAERNPASDIRPADVLKARKKVNYARVDAKELPELLRKMHAYDGSVYTRYALQLIALTFVRTSELIEATWSEFDLAAAEWRLPAERMKMRTPHVVPLSRQALDALRCLREVKGLSDLVFPGERNHDRPMSNNTLLKALERMGYKHRMTGHGFRGVASTMLHELGFRHDVIELQLAHQQRDDVSAAYNWATYLPERRKMMQAWADYLDAARQGRISRLRDSSKRST